MWGGVGVGRGCTCWAIDSICIVAGLYHIPRGMSLGSWFVLEIFMYLSKKLYFFASALTDMSELSNCPKKLEFSFSFLGIFCDYGGVRVPPFDDRKH